jgi:hypothetical protein
VRIVGVLDATQRCIEEKLKEIPVKGAFPKVNDTDLFHLERVFLRIGGSPTVLLLSLASSIASAILYALIATSSMTSSPIPRMTIPHKVNMAKQSLRS